MNKNKSFSSRAGGFKLIFPNGLELSTQFTGGNYCENCGNDSLLTKKFTSMDFIESKNCEIAVFNKNNEFITKKVLKVDSDVLGYIYIDKWFEILDKVKTYVNKLDLKKGVSLR